MYIFISPKLKYVSIHKEVKYENYRQCYVLSFQRFNAGLTQMGEFSYRMDISIKFQYNVERNMQLHTKRLLYNPFIKVISKKN